MTQSRTAAGELLTDRQGSIVQVDHPSTMCYFQPETEELIFISEAEAVHLENHSNKMIDRVARLHDAQAVHLRMVDLYARAREKPMMAPAEEEDLVLQVSAAEEALEVARQNVRKELGAFSQKGMGYDDVVELIPIGARGSRGRRNPYAYVTRKYFDDSKAGNRLRNVSLKSRAFQGGRDSVYKVNKNGKRSIDTNLLMRQLSTLEKPKLKLALKDVMAWAGAEKALEDLNKDLSLFEWAESWNESLVGAKAVNDHLDVSGGAQFMRFISNVGASTEYDPATGQVALKGEASANLTLASGKVGFARFAPDRVGWSLAYQRSNGETFDMGKLRLMLSGDLLGYIGGSVVLAGQLQVVTKGDQQLLAGQAQGRLPRFERVKTRQAPFYKQMEAEEEGLDLSAQAFAGLKVEASLKGAVQWLKPADPPDVNAPQKTLNGKGSYVDFCSLSPSIAGLAGVGAGMKFHCSFVNGKFYFHFAASLCWGAGAKGKLACEVNANNILEFGAWLAYQLYTLNYAFFDLVSKDAFEVYSKYCVMQMQDLKDDMYEGYGRLRLSVDHVLDRFDEFVKSVLDVPGDGIGESRARNELARNVVDEKVRLLSCTPETKGMLIYLLTRHGKWDDLDHQTYSAFMDRHHHRKEAVICILRSIQTRQEWNRVMCRVTINGGRKDKSHPAHAVIEKQESSLVEFLQIGFNRDDELYQIKKELEEVRDGLKENPTLGYALAMNNTIYYQLNSCDNPHFPTGCSFGPYQEGHA